MEHKISDVFLNLEFLLDFLFEVGISNLENIINDSKEFDKNILKPPQELPEVYASGLNCEIMNTNES